MNKFFIAALLLLATTVANAAPKSGVLARGLLQGLSGVSKVQVLELNRKWQYLLVCTVSTLYCLNGRREYGMDVRLTTDEYGDLDFNCHVEHYYRKKKISIKDCIGAGHKFSITNFTGMDSGTAMIFSDRM